MLRKVTLAIVVVALLSAIVYAGSAFAQQSQQKVPVAAVRITNTAGVIHAIATGPWNRCGNLTTKTVWKNSTTVKVAIYQILAPEGCMDVLHPYQVPIDLESLAPGLYKMRVNNYGPIEVIVE